MTKAAEKTERRLREFGERKTRLDLLISAFASGLDQQIDGNKTDEGLIASEIIGKYRPMMSDKNNVNWDGSVYEDIKRAIEAGVERGKKKRTAVRSDG